LNWILAAKEDGWEMYDDDEGDDWDHMRMSD